MPANPAANAPITSPPARSGTAAQEPCASVSPAPVNIAGNRSRASAAELTYTGVPVSTARPAGVPSVSGSRCQAATASSG